MSPTSRRIFLYSLLLLVPALLVGSGAVYLLLREQKRLADRSADAEEAKRTAVIARAELIAENVELLVGDVQTGLLDALSATPSDELDAFLREWESSNPLVRVAFVAAPDGGLIRPGDSADVEARGFVRRFQKTFGSTPPWQLAPATMEPEIAEQASQRQVLSNVAQVQSARRDVQKLLKSKEYAAKVASVAERDQRRLQERARAPSAALGAADAIGEIHAAAAPRSEAEALADQVSPERRGWRAFTVDGRSHLIGWVQPQGGKEVRGIELELASLISRLAGALPAEVNSGEGFALRNETTKIMHQAGQLSRSVVPVIAIPIAQSMLPGWEVLAFASAEYGASTVSGAFIWVAGMLVAIFVTAILAGGWLLLRQARRSEEEAAQKTSFVANVSHEFKTPLTTIRLYAELLEQGRVRDSAQSGEYLRTIGNETQRLARLVNNALDFSRLEQGRKKFAPQTVDLRAELSRILDTQEPRVGEEGLRLFREFPDDAVSVSTDVDSLEQILLNLLDNAWKYGASGGEVTVTLERKHAGLEIRVADRGPGVPVEHRERIFEKFHRVDETLVVEKSGAGLGLSIARQLARGMGGELCFQPRPGGGSVFILQLK